MSGNSNRYESIQVVSLPNDFILAKGMVDLMDYTPSEVEEILSSYDLEQEAVENMGDDMKRILAECLFDAEVIDYLFGEHYSSLAEAVEALAKYVEKGDK